MAKNKTLNFLNSFSKEEWAMNGHKKEDACFLANIFSDLLPYVKGGRYLELGCGTGILCKFISRFCAKKIIPYGVDMHPDFIALAKKNNSRYRKNFSVGDYFAIKPALFPKFATISIFSTDNKPWGKLKKLADSLLESGKCDTLIIFCYKHNFCAGINSEAAGLIRALKRHFYQVSFAAKFIIAKRTLRKHQIPAKAARPKVV